MDPQTREDGLCMSISLNLELKAKYDFNPPTCMNMSINE